MVQQRDFVIALCMFVCVCVCVCVCNIPQKGSQISAKVPKRLSGSIYMLCFSNIAE